MPNHQSNSSEPRTEAYKDVGVNPSRVDYDNSSIMSTILGAEVEARSAADIRREARGRSSRIFDAYNLLREIITRHEAVIGKRWLKKTKQQKLKILLSAWPNMAAAHCPDFNAFRKGVKQRPTKDRDGFIWPHINQEDLSQPKALLLLLNARGRHPPAEFSGTDDAVMHLGRLTGNVMPAYLDGYVMIINGATNQEEYGKLLSWNDHPDAFDWVRTRKQYLPGEGLLVLEVQERLLTFLVECCKQILHDIPDHKMVSNTFPTRPEPAMIESELRPLDSLSIMAAQAPYRVPALLNWGNLKLIIEARLSAAEDHLWALREDPSYFDEQLHDIKEHQLETSRDTRGQIHPILRPGRQSRFWACVISTVVTNAYVQLEVFAELHRQVQHIECVQKEYQGGIDPTKELPEKYLLAILKFRYYVNQTSKSPLAALQTQALASPPLRRYYIRQPFDATSSMMEVIEKPGIKPGTIESQLTWLLRTLWEDKSVLSLAGMHLIIDELERLLHAEKKASDLVSGRVAATIGDISIMSHCIREVDLYLPWARGFRNALMARNEILKENYAETIAPWEEMILALDAENISEVAKLGNPSDKKLFYPISKRRTKDNVQALQQAERNLDDFWTAIDQLVYAKCGHLNGTDVQRLLSQPHIIQRTPDWVDNVLVAADAPERGDIKHSDSAQYLNPMSMVWIGLKAKAPKKPAESQKGKVKTRGTPHEAPPSFQTTGEADTEETPASIPVDARSLKVFRTIFHNPANDFLHAMTSTGMFSAKKLYGSVWQFEKLDGPGSIQFHEPHPRGKIPFFTARRHGRRLTKTFGLVAETFRPK
ncbi:hypothetical protein F4677DRAFT_463575 [Hypoxylon crocopeplum]|nr:hypothetical protein F4677DRAFT_463575 [Hypoxylon crocopeplum]